MSDQSYQTVSYRLESRGVVARFVSDDLPKGSFSQLNNLESRAENAIASRLGLAALSTDGSTNLPLGGPVYSISRMKGLDQPFRYAGAAGALYRRTGDAVGAFSQIANGLSGQRLSMFPYRPDGNASPYMFIADKNVLLKDNGTNGAAQNWGGSPPFYPPSLQIGDPNKTIVEVFDEANTSSFTFVNYGSPDISQFRLSFASTQALTPGQSGIVEINVPTGLAADVARTGNVATVHVLPPVLGPSGGPFLQLAVGMKITIQGCPDPSFNTAAAVVTSVTVPGFGFTSFTYANPGPNVGAINLLPGTTTVIGIMPSILAGMLISIVDPASGGANPETIYVLTTGLDRFTAKITIPRPFGIVATAHMLTGSIAANTVASISKRMLTGLGLVGGIPNEGDDYIQFGLQVSDPLTIKEIKIFFDVGDATFTQDYYYKSVTPSSYQPSVTGQLTSDQVQSARVFDRASASVDVRRLGVVTPDLAPEDLPDVVQLRPVELNTGRSAWSTIQVRLSEFVPVGLAGGPNNNWANVVAWRIQVTAAPNTPATVAVSSLGLIGGAGLDSFAGAPYDYRYTYYNINTGYETNPSVTLSSQYFQAVRRQPIAVTFQQSNDSVFQLQNDSQFTHARLYRRGGTLTQAWYRVAQVPLTLFPAVFNGGVIFNIGNLQLVDTSIVIPVGTQINVSGNTYGPLNGPHTVATSGPGFVTFPLAVPNGTGFGGTISEFTLLPLTYTDSLDDATAEFRDQLQIDNDPPVTSTLRTPINLTNMSFNIVNFQGGAIVSMTVPAGGQNVNQIVPGQLITVGSGSNQEIAYVLDVQQPLSFRAFLQNPHSNGETITANATPRRPMNLMAIAFDKAWLAGDPDNPHVLYYSKPVRPESFPPQNFIEVGTPDSPIMFLVALKGLLYVFTTKTVYQVLGAGSSVPVVIPTGVMHGAVSNFGWVASEGVIYYESYDGIYAFQGASSPYLSAATEWVWTGKNLGPVPAMDTTQKAEVFMAYCNHEVYISYLDQNGQRNRQIWSDTYTRWRSDDQSTSDITAQYFEQDTGKFLVGKTDGMVYIDRVNDYDSGGFIGGVEIKNPINIALQTPQMDMGTLKAFKQYNNLTLDWDTNGQLVTLSLLLNSGATVVPLGTFSQAGRGQTQININNGLGLRSLNVALLITGAVTQLVTVNEISIGALVEAEFRRSVDSFWMKWGTDENKLVKTGYFEYQSTQPVSYSVYIEGSSTARYTFTLPSTGGVRLAKRMRFPAVKAKLWRFVGTSTEDFQMYNESAVEVKGIRGEKGYMPQKLDPAAVA